MKQQHTADTLMIPAPVSHAPVTWHNSNLDPCQHTSVTNSHSSTPKAKRGKAKDRVNTTPAAVLAAALGSPGDWLDAFARAAVVPASFVKEHTHHEAYADLQLPALRRLFTSNHALLEQVLQPLARKALRQLLLFPEKSAISNHQQQTHKEGAQQADAAATDLPEIPRTDHDIINLVAADPPRPDICSATAPMLPLVSPLVGSAALLDGDQQGRAAGAGSTAVLSEASGSGDVRHIAHSTNESSATGNLTSSMLLTLMDYLYCSLVLPGHGQAEPGRAAAGEAEPGCQTEQQDAAVGSAARAAGHDEGGGQLQHHPHQQPWWRAHPLSEVLEEQDMQQRLRRVADGAKMLVADIAGEENHTPHLSVKPGACLMHRQVQLTCY
jgi:hypothetical protein